MIRLLRASHPGPSAVVTAIATVLAIAVGRGPAGAVAVAAAVASGQLAVGWTNDLVDRERDRAAGRLDKPVAIGVVRATAVRTAAICALVACVPLSLLSGWRAAVVHLGAVGIALAYDLGVKSTLASVVPYAVAFGCLPAFVTLGLPAHPWPPWWAIVAAAMLGAGAHFLNVLADLEDDRRAGVHGLPQRIGPHGSLGIGVALMAGAAVLLLVAPPGDPRAGAWAAVGLAWIGAGAAVVAARRGHPRATWICALAVAGSTVLLLLVGGTTL